MSALVLRIIPVAAATAATAPPTAAAAARLTIGAKLSVSAGLRRALLAGR
jgi:hypothetical protein